jgi:hypothetical protein
MSATRTTTTTIKLAFLILPLYGSYAFAATFMAFGPHSYVREKDKPAVFTTSFSLQNPDTPYSIRLESKRIDEDHDRDSDRDSDDHGPRARARVLLNGTEIVDPDDFRERTERGEDRGRGRRSC